MLSFIKQVIPMHGFNLLSIIPVMLTKRGWLPFGHPKSNQPLSLPIIGIMLTGFV
jgi:hypothetical protein